eukprot:TRINITY_DN5890_c0_g1_i1.p1 TRINITY_DN5890_c0_g1~~TRINITY_DN5890_c0_g1_i1.p1  ORF type:complete len:190 (-),score=16.31 TRINITY_DN5890_c0_g1_i1:240-740(-)
MKNMNQEDIADLDLIFAVEHENSLSDKKTETDLVPNGKHIAVNHRNQANHGMALAHHYLSKATNKFSRAFRRGLEYIIPSPWLSFFNPHELQFLISGKQGSLDLEDLRRNTIYSNGYHEDHVVVLIFWHVLASFTPEEQSLLLKFVTACSRVSFPLSTYSESSPHS